MDIVSIPLRQVKGNRLWRTRKGCGKPGLGEIGDPKETFRLPLICPRVFPCRVLHLFRVFCDRAGILISVRIGCQVKFPALSLQRTQGQGRGSRWI
jgi:hypothetical protein